MPPIQVVHRADAKLLQEGTIAESGYESGRMRLVQPQQRLDVEVVIVVVCHEDQVNGRQILEGQAGSAHAFGAEAAKGTDALRVHGIGQNVEAVELQQEGDVIYECQCDLAAREVRWQGGLGTVWYPLGPQLALPCPLPTQEITKGTARLRARVEKVVAIEVVGGWSVVAGSAFK